MGNDRILSEFSRELVAYLISSFSDHLSLPGNDNILFQGNSE